MLAKLRPLERLRDVNTDQQNRGLQAALVIDRDTAGRLGIQAQAIDDTLYDAFGQRQVSTIYTSLNQYHVVLEVAPEFQQNPDALKAIYVKSSTGAQVPLSAITRFVPSTTPLAVNHQGFFPSVTLSFNLAPGVALSDAVGAIQVAEREIGLPASIRASFQGTAQAFQDSLANQPILILAALVTVYIVLGVLYESYVHPITILSTLPSAGVGAIIALMLCGMELNVIALIGIILLIGIVKKNAIMMIDFALDAERRDGKTPADAIYEACLLRFRPIMMTTMAAMLGGLPLALGTGTGAELRRPLGITIVGGLIVSQLLTLYTTPVVYLYLERVRSVLSRRRAGALSTRSAEARGCGQVQQARAVLERDRARVSQAKAALARDVAQAKNAETQERRYRDLLGKELIAREQYDQIKATYDSLNATLNADEADVAGAEETVRVDDAAIRSAEQVVRADEASVENARLQLSYTVIRSPVDGRTG